MPVFIEFSRCTGTYSCAKFEEVSYEQNYFETIKKQKQLRKISFKDVISAGFTDDTEQFFTIRFDVGNGARQDLTVAFETRSPRMYLSGEYRD